MPPPFLTKKIWTLPNMYSNVCSFVAPIDLSISFLYYRACNKLKMTECNNFLPQSYILSLDLKLFLWLSIWAHSRDNYYLFVISILFRLIIKGKKCNCSFFSWPPPAARRWKMKNDLHVKKWTMYDVEPTTLPVVLSRNL